jgi:carbamoylphosphate synthase large subunit
MSQVRVWWNDAPSSTYHDIARSVSIADPIQVHALASHRDPNAPMLAAAHGVIDEPADDSFIAEVIAACRRHRVDVLVPRRRQHDLAAAADQIRAECGTVVLGPSASVVVRCDDKLLAYQGAVAAGADVPGFALLQSADDIATAATQFRRWCVRPVRGEAGEGFRIVLPDRDGPSASRVTGRAAPMVTTGELAAAFDAGLVGALLASELITGVEYSVDCLAHRGELAAVIARRRDPLGGFVIEAQTAAIDLARRLVTSWGIDGLVNVQCIVRDGAAYLIEVNPRAAGGLHLADHTGVSLAYEAIVAAVHGAPRSGLQDIIDARLPLRLITAATPAMSTL